MGDDPGSMKARAAAAFFCLLLAGCSDDAGVQAPSAAGPAAWRAGLEVKGIVDVAGPRSDGRLVLAADGRLSLMRPGARPTPFARGAGGYATQRGPEPYIAVSKGEAPSGAGCRFPRDSVYALEPQGRKGIVAVSATGRARRLVDLQMRGLPNGITFDTTGRFGHRLIATVAHGNHATVLAVDCKGHRRTLTRSAPRVEGGMVVAPAGFGRFGGELIAPDELSGRIWAISPKGRARLVAESGLPAGGDIGVESAGFVPPNFRSGWRAYLADRVSPGNAHPGDDAALTIGERALRRSGVRAGDLLVASEGGAQTIAVRCRTRCSVTHVADGPTAAHGEGHIAFAPR
jgi:hypothetical protein